MLPRTLCNCNNSRLRVTGGFGIDALVPLLLPHVRMLAASNALTKLSGSCPLHLNLILSFYSKGPIRAQVVLWPWPVVARIWLLQSPQDPGTPRAAAWYWTVREHRTTLSSRTYLHLVCLRNGWRWQRRMTGDCFRLLHLTIVIFPASTTATIPMRLPPCALGMRGVKNWSPRMRVLC